MSAVSGVKRLSLAAFIRRLEKQMTAIGVERDKLDDLISEASELLEDCNEAKDNLQRARDALSELV